MFSCAKTTVVGYFFLILLPFMGVVIAFLNSSSGDNEVLKTIGFFFAFLLLAMRTKLRIFPFEATRTWFNPS